MQHPAVRSGQGRGPFEKAAELASNFTGSPLFYGICLLLVAGFIAVAAAGLASEWLAFAGGVMSAVTLLILALLKNSELRAEHAVQQKLDAIARALLAERENEVRQARDQLARAIRLEEEI